MKKIIEKLGDNNKTLVNGATALFIIALIALGCTCNKEFDLANIGKESDNRTVSNTSNSDAKNEDAKTKVPTKKADASKGEIPADDELQYITKTTLLDFNEAIRKADFTDFHGKISKTWQKQITPEKFKQSFNTFIEKGLDISNIKQMDANFSPSPKIDKSRGVKELVLEGRYNTSPLPAKFKLNYIAEGKEWKLYGIELDTRKDY